MENTQDCRSFTQALASSSPTPGGGAAAALMGALAAGLCSMAAKLTAGRKNFAAAPEAQNAARQAEELRLELLRLMEEDERAFLPLYELYRADRNGADWQERYRQAALAACAPAMEMLRCGERMVELLEELAEICSPMLISDVGCAAAACQALIRAAMMNALVNLRGLGQAGESLRERALGASALADRAGRLCARVTKILED